MKYLLSLILLIITLQSSAQIIIPIEQEKNYNSLENSNSYYYKDINGVFNKFIGRWKYQTGNEVVELLIFKLEKHNFGNYFQDQICIQFKYTKNGVILINTLNNSAYNYLISGGRFKNPNNVNQIHFIYLEPNQDFENKHQWLDIEYLSTLNGPQLHWVAFFEAFTIETLAPKMPLDMVFVKQP